MSALGKIIGGAASAILPGASGALYAATHGKVGIDATPGFSATNLAKNAATKVITAGSNNPKTTTYKSPGVSQKFNGVASSGGANPYGGGSSYDPGAAAAGQQLVDLRNQALSRIYTIQGVYDALNQAVDSVVQDKAGQLRKNYGTQADQLNNTFKATGNQLVGNYQGRGTYDSSDRANAQDTATNTYKTNLDQINQSEASDLANLGQYANTAHSQYSNARNSYGDYITGIQNGTYGAPDLQTIYNNLGGDLQTAQNQQAGLGTQQSFVNSVNAIAPSQNQGASQLQSQLQAVLNSSAPGFAKQAIGAGLITQATQGDPAAQDAATKYFQQLQTTAGS